MHPVLLVIVITGIVVSLTWVYVLRELLYVVVCVFVLSRASHWNHNLTLPSFLPIYVHIIY